MCFRFILALIASLRGNFHLQKPKILVLLIKVHMVQKNETLLQLSWNFVIVPLGCVALAFSSSTVRFRTFGLVFRVVHGLFGLFVLGTFSGQALWLDLVLSSWSAPGSSFVSAPWPAPGRFSGFLSGFVTRTTPWSLSVSSSGPAPRLATPPCRSTPWPSLSIITSDLVLKQLKNSNSSNTFHGYHPFYAPFSLPLFAVVLCQTTAFLCFHV